MKIGIYCRISKLKGGNDLSIGDQQQTGIEKAIELAIPYEIYIDEGISGATENISDRPAFERLLGDVATGVLTHVFCYDQSRLERNPQLRFVIVELFKKHNIIFITKMGGTEDLEDPQQQFFGDLMSVINKFHVTTTKIKVKSALLSRVRQGKSRGILPYGYTKDENDSIIIDEDEAEIVKRIFQMSLDGIGTRTIADALNEEGVLTKYNKIGEGTLSVKNKYTGSITTTDKTKIKWSPNTVSGIIKNPFYKGERIYSNEKINVPAILTSDYWDKVNFNKPLNANNTGKKVEYRYLLKGSLRCGVCGRNMYGKKRIDKHDNHYMCSSKRVKGENCGNRSINIDKLERFVWEHLYSKDGFVSKLNDEFTIQENEFEIIETKIDAINKKIKMYQGERKKAIGLTVKGLVSESEISGVLSRLVTKIQNEEKVLNELKQNLFNIKHGEEILERYRYKVDDLSDVATFTQKQKIIKDLIKNIIIEFINGKYILKIDYHLPIKQEYWVSENLKSNAFYRIVTDINGNQTCNMSVETTDSQLIKDKYYVIGYMKKLNKELENNTYTL